MTCRYGVTGIPTMNVYVKGEVVKTLVGALPKPKLAARAGGLHRLTGPASSATARRPPQVGRAADCCPGLPSLQMTVPPSARAAPRPRKVGMSDHLPALFRLGDEGDGVLAIRERLQRTGVLPSGDGRHRRPRRLRSSPHARPSTGPTEPLRYDDSSTRRPLVPAAARAARRRHRRPPDLRRARRRPVEPRRPAAVAHPRPPGAGRRRGRAAGAAARPRVQPRAGRRPVRPQHRAGRARLPARRGPGADGVVGPDDAARLRRPAPLRHRRLAAHRCASASRSAGPGTAWPGGPSCSTPATAATTPAPSAHGLRRGGARCTTSPAGSRAGSPRTG